jgi:hypothetical protein
MCTMTWKDLGLLVGIVGVMLALIIFISMIILPAPPEFGDLNISKLPAEMATKAESCHKNGMKAGRLIENGNIIAIKCYEE